MNAGETALQAIEKNGQAIAKQKTVYDMIEMQKKAFARVLSDEKQADRFTRIAITALKNNPALAQCETTSVIAGLMLSAQLGLEPNSPLHEASLIPYGGKAQFQIEYRGLEKLAWQSGLVKVIDYGMICENDEYEYEIGMNFKFAHKPNLRTERGAPFAYYAYAELINGGRVVHVMSKVEILEHAKKFSKSWNGTDFSGKGYNGKPGKPGVWDTNFDSMAIKTVLKALCDKKLPKRTTDEAIKFQTAIDKDQRIAPIIDIEKIEQTDFTEIPMEYPENADVETGEIFGAA